MYFILSVIIINKQLTKVIVIVIVDIFLNLEMYVEIKIRGSRNSNNALECTIGSESGVAMLHRADR